MYLSLPDSLPFTHLSVSSLSPSRCLSLPRSSLCRAHLSLTRSPPPRLISAVPRRPEAPLPQRMPRRRAVLRRPEASPGTSSASGHRTNLLRREPSFSAASTVSPRCAETSAASRSSPRCEPYLRRALLLRRNSEIRVKLASNGLLSNPTRRIIRGNFRTQFHGFNLCLCGYLFGVS